MSAFFLSLLSLTTLVQSSPILSVKTVKTCQEYNIPLNLTTLNLKWALDPLETNEDAAAYSIQGQRRDAMTVFQPVTPPTAPETAVYTVAGTFCQPASGGNGTVLLATHGGGYDRYYWDPSIQPENYSFVEYAVARGYSIFYYDRVGLGESQSVSGYVAQTSIHTAVVKELVKVIRSGKFGHPPSKVALVGHSLGSAYSNGVLNSDPDLVDAAVLTGFAYNVVPPSGGTTLLAKLEDPFRFGGLDGGWTTWADVYSNIQSFFKPPFYDRKVVQWTEDNKQPTGLLEGISIGAANFSSPGFTGPVLILSGEYDLIACGGYCPGFLETGPSQVFPAAKPLVTYIQPKSGHAVNFALNATGSFDVITKFLKQNGI
ncbi:hypothetical protein Z517_11011 [Fonsecaea pedrosoi CBS 271.37]|uniref:Serine aminopeptidase S33 domain-containing protein n=1 Tax=Fonsecaea pedrosoi CBS 271.37 TaxID=1442368 RepID=A0A0D2GBU0_9EURO|nr:uncharacterized protein Z517_11011 [Fonsecaea pedrosoi CBS 271.37]KIW76265.1 hypothetical protein Z517_11011 [Fonsecaea pedrosoi CBS 271.37]